jgi:SAM-dependent methyltransferase
MRFITEENIEENTEENMLNQRKTCSTNGSQTYNRLVQQELCNCCGQKRWQKLYTNYDFLERGKKTPTYDIYQCLNCGLIVTERDNRPEKTSSYYPKTYAAYQGKKSLRKQRLKIFLYFLLRSPVPTPVRWLREFVFYPISQRMRGFEIKPQAKVLDIGCGSGKFLSIIKPLNMIPFGVEVDEKACELSKRITEDIYLGPFETIGNYKFSNNPAMKFELIFANGVISQVTDPAQFLQNVKTMLADNGTAIISAASSRSLWAKLFGKYWANLETPRGLFFLAPQNMQMYCDKCQLKIKNIRFKTSTTTSVAFSLIHLFEDKWQLSSRWRKLFLRTSLVLGPLLLLIQLLKLGDSVEYHLIHK